GHTYIRRPRQSDRQGKYIRTPEIRNKMRQGRLGKRGRKSNKSLMTSPQHERQVSQLSSSNPIASPVSLSFNVNHTPTQPSHSSNVYYQTQVEDYLFADYNLDDTSSS